MKRNPFKKKASQYRLIIVKPCIFHNFYKKTKKNRSLIKQVYNKKEEETSKQRNPLKKKKASQYRLINVKPCIFHKFYKKTKKKKFDKMGIQKKNIQIKINQCETMNIPQI